MNTNQDMGFAIYQRFTEAWDNVFYQSLKIQDINDVINSYTAFVTMSLSFSGGREADLDLFEDRWSGALDRVYEEAPRGADFTLAWHRPGDRSHPAEVQAITLINPFQRDAFHHQIIAGPELGLGMQADYISAHGELHSLERWQLAAQSILEGCEGEPAESNMRYFTTRNTMFPPSAGVAADDGRLLVRRA